MYRGADNGVSRVLTRGHVGASIAASRKRDGRRRVARWRADMSAISVKLWKECSQIGSTTQAKL
jgi:hypothetical protein